MPIYPPLHPGQHIKQALIDDEGLSLPEAAERLGITATFLMSLIDGKTRITPEMALRLSRLLGSSLEAWLKLQTDYDAWRQAQTAFSL